MQREKHTPVVVVGQRVDTKDYKGKQQKGCSTPQTMGQAVLRNHGKNIARCGAETGREPGGKISPHSYQAALRGQRTKIEVEKCRKSGSKDWNGIEERIPVVLGPPCERKKTGRMKLKCGNAGGGGG